MKSAPQTCLSGLRLGGILLAVGLLFPRLVRIFAAFSWTWMLFFCLVCYIARDFWWKRRSLPPGPLPLLAIGNMISLIIADFDNIMAVWRRKYGGIYTVWIGPFPLVMVNNINIMKKYFVQNADIFSNRWRNYVTDTFMGGVHGVIQIDGDQWREQRRFALHVLRDFGVGRSMMERKIIGEVRNLCSYLKEKEGGPCEVTTPLAVCVGNIINDMLFGVTFPQGSPEMQHLHHLLDAQSRLVVNPIMGLYIALPITTRIPLLNIKWKQLMRQRDHLWTFLRKQVKEHKDKFSEGHSSIDDFTHAYLAEMDARQTSGTSMGHFSEWQLTMLLLDLFFAGMETTVTTLKWAIVMIIKHPEVQRRVQEELDCIGSKEILLSDRNNTPYTQATINEIQRIANILPINLLRTVAETVEIDGFTFPKGTMVIPQIATLLNDENVFEDPNDFKPSRFLDEEGKLHRFDEFIPFSIGKRQCLGESLARAELYLIFANLLKQFNFEPVEGEVYSTKRLLGLTVSPPKYLVNIVPRKSDVNMNIAT